MFVSSSKRAPRKFLAAQWRHLIMRNFVVDPETVKPFVPRGTKLDFHGGETFVSIVGFMFYNTRLLGLPIPWHRTFEELNLRIYVRREIGHELRRGVVFIKELVPRWWVANVARWAYNENYEWRAMRHQIAGTVVPDSVDGRSVAYEWNVAGRWHRLSVRATGTSRPPSPGSHEEFIAEHYWGYARQRDGGTVEYQVDHPPWHVWDVSHSEFDCDVAGLYGSTFADVLSRPPASAFLADGSEVVVYRPTRIA